jgi:predicted membrane protein
MARRLSSQVVLGAAIIVVGLLLLLDSTGTYDAAPLLDYVPSLFVLAALYAMVSSRFRNLVGPLIVVVVAGAWQLVTLDVVAADEVGELWPLLLVVLGLALVAGRFRARPTEAGGDVSSTIALFGGRNQRVTSASFASADATALFGGVELDLRDAEVADPPAQVSAFVLFGGVDVVVPRDWNVQLDVFPVFGGAEDERPRRDEEHDETDLVVTGIAAFGGVTVKD